MSKIFDEPTKYKEKMVLIYEDEINLILPEEIKKYNLKKLNCF